MVRTADVGSYVAEIYQASPPQQLLVEEHSRLEWSEEEMTTFIRTRMAE